MRMSMEPRPAAGPARNSIEFPALPRAARPYLWLACPAGFAVFYSLYLRASLNEIIWGAYFEQMFLADKLFGHSLQWGDLWVPFGHHGMFAYNLLFLFNVA